jgi:hypothetical protein
MRYVFRSMHKLFAQWAFTGKSVVSVNNIQCRQPLLNVNEMCSVVLKIKHTDQCAEKHSVTLMHFVQRINRRFSLCGVKLLVFLTVAPLGKCCLLNALCHFSSRTIMSPLNKTVNKLYVNIVKNCQVTKKVGYLLSIWVISVFSRITLTHGVCLELPRLLYTLKFQTAHWQLGRATLVPIILTFFLPSS